MNSALTTREPTAAETALVARYEALRAELPGTRHAWITTLRGRAIDALAREGLPHRRIEDWKYTDLRGKLDEIPAFPEPATGAPLRAAGGDPFAGLNMARAVLVDGFWRADLSDLGALAEDVEITSLAEALEAGDPHLGAYLDPHGGAFRPVEALSTAFMRDGLIIRVKKDRQVALPLGLLSLAASGSAASVFGRILIELEEGAALTLMETHEGATGAARLTAMTLDVRLGDKARLDHLRYQGEAVEACHLALTRVHLARDAVYAGAFLTTGARVSRHEVEIVFEGEGAEARLDGAYLLKGGQHADTTTLVRHEVPHCASSQSVRGVLADNARGVFQGRIEVAEDAQKTDAHMQSRALLMSPRAEADQKPELIIYADDVKCSHGATAGEIDHDALFYLRSRGIDEASARGLLVRAFLDETYRLEAEDRHSAVLGAIDGWLEASGLAHVPHEFNEEEEA